MKKGILLVKTDFPLTLEVYNRIHAVIEPLCVELQLEPLVLEKGMDAGVSYDLSPLIAAMQAQTEAINSLAASNLELVHAMTQGEDTIEPTRYLDGTKR